MRQSTGCHSPGIKVCWDEAPRQGKILKAGTLGLAHHNHVRLFDNVLKQWRSTIPSSCFLVKFNFPSRIPEQCERPGCCSGMCNCRCFATFLDLGEGFAVWSIVSTMMPPAASSNTIQAVHQVMTLVSGPGRNTRGNPILNLSLDQCLPALPTVGVSGTRLEAYSTARLHGRAEKPLCFRVAAVAPRVLYRGPVRS